MDSDTVTWDQAEPEDLLFWVQRALQRYIENPGCEECLGLAREGLGRLRPGLEVAGQHDAIPLCEELFRVAAALDEGRLQWSPDVSALLSRAAPRLSGAPDSAGSPLLPLVNELRALRGVGALMMPAIVGAAGAAPAPAAPKRVREALQAPDAGRSRTQESQSGHVSDGHAARRADPPAQAPVREKAKAPSPPVAQTGDRIRGSGHRGRHSRWSGFPDAPLRS